MTTPLIDTLLPGTVLVTAGQRLYRHLLQQYVLDSRARGLTVWETPAVLTFRSWLSRLWEEAVDLGADQRLLLGDVQEQALWEQVVAQTGDFPSLAAPSLTARLARDAWSLAQAWDFTREDIARATHDDALAFAAWASAFDEQCRRRGWLDSAQLVDVLAGHVATRRIPLPSRVVFAGFDDITPAQRRLIDALRTAGCEAIMWSPPSMSAAPVRTSFRSFNDEILAAAHWARRELLAQPDKRLGIVAHDLAQHGAFIRRVFDDVLVPASIVPGQQDAPRPYNLSYGEPLTAQVPVRTAFALLTLAETALPWNEAGELLRSPYIAGAEAEMTARAGVDADLRYLGDARVTIGSLLHTIARSGKGTPLSPILGERLQRLRAAAPARGERRLPSQWLGVFTTLLHEAGWPGDRGLTSAEYQMIAAWNEALNTFGALDTVITPLRYREAIARLQALTQEKLFQVETPETPIQILGAFEASGLSFDALWVMGMTDDVWPAAARPNPFLPVALQRTRGVPHASAERELEFCTRLTQRLCASAPTVVFSYAEREQDRPLRPSPLIRDFPLQARIDPAIDPAIESGSEPVALKRYRDQVHETGTRASFVDIQATELAPGSVVRGGTSLFRAQSACAFRGYAEYRLAAKPLDEPQPGLGARDRGILLHGVMARVWTDLGSHVRLVSVGADELLSRVTGIVRDEVERIRRRRPETVTDAIALLEAERLTALVLEWLELEKQRAPFTVRSGEAPARAVIADIITEMRMDRLDELADGSLAVIDYKTGVVNVNDWFGVRPAEPQLPLYALYGVERDKVGALLYARLRPGDQKFAGTTRGADQVPGVKSYAESALAKRQESWSGMLEDWEIVLSALAQQHRRGDAPVNPRDANTCRQCHLHAFCRVYERAARLADAEPEDADE